MGSDPERTFSGPEREYIMETYDVMLGTFKEYAEMIIQVIYINTADVVLRAAKNVVSLIMQDYFRSFPVHCLGLHTDVAVNLFSYNGLFVSLSLSLSPPHGSRTTCSIIV